MTLFYTWLRLPYRINFGIIVHITFWTWYTMSWRLGCCLSISKGRIRKPYVPELLVRLGVSPRIYATIDTMAIVLILSLVTHLYLRLIYLELAMLHNIRAHAYIFDPGKTCIVFAPRGLRASVAYPAASFNVIQLWLWPRVYVFWLAIISSTCF